MSGLGGVSVATASPLAHHGDKEPSHEHDGQAEGGGGRRFWQGALGDPVKGGRGRGVHLDRVTMSLTAHDGTAGRDHHMVHERDPQHQEDAAHEPPQTGFEDSWRPHAHMITRGGSAGDPAPPRVVTCRGETGANNPDR